MMKPPKWARAWCKQCRLVCEAQYEGRKPVGIECPNCEGACPISGVSPYPLKAFYQGVPLYLLPEDDRRKDMGSRADNYKNLGGPHINGA